LERKNENNEKKIRKLIFEQLPHFGLTVFCSVILALIIQIVIFIPTLLMQHTIDIYIPNKDVNGIVLSIALFCAIPFVVTAFSTIYKYFLAIVCRKMGFVLSTIGFQNLLNQPINYFEKNNSSELASYCRTEAMKYIVFWVIEIPRLIAIVLSGIVIYYYLFTTNWIIAALLLLYIPVSYFPSDAFGKKIQKLSGKIVENNAKMSQVINDSFKGIKFVKAMGIEKSMVDKLKRINEDSLSIWNKVTLFDNLSGIWVEDFSDRLFTGLAFGLGAYFVLKGEMTLGGVVLILSFTREFLDIVKKCVYSNYDFKAQLGEYSKLFEILLMNHHENNNKGSFVFKEEIVFSDVVFSYEEERGPVLESFDLTIKNGEWLGIVGPSGSGKTTIFDLLLCFYTVKKGNIKIDDIEVKQISSSLLREKITKVSQDTFLFPGTIKENLLLANPEASEEKLMSVLCNVQLDGLIERLPDGLNTIIGENGFLLSGGERQRIGLAQGLLRNSEIILLDEVTANIDKDSENEICSILREISDNRKITIVSISHKIDFLKYTDRIAILRGGRIQEITEYSKINH